MYELLDQHRELALDIVSKYEQGKCLGLLIGILTTLMFRFPKLIAYMDRFEKLPAIESYMKSDRFLKRPINNKTAKFGGS